MFNEISREIGKQSREKEDFLKRIRSLEYENNALKEKLKVTTEGLTSKIKMLETKLRQL